MPDPKTTSHFVAHLKIEKVEKPESAIRDRGVPDSVRPGRVIDEVTQITIKGDTLENLVSKLGKHIAIIEED